MNAEGQRDSDEDVEEEAEGAPAAGLSNDEQNGQGAEALEDLQVIADLNGLDINNIDDGPEWIADDNIEDEEVDPGEGTSASKANENHHQVQPEKQKNKKSKKK